MSAELVSILIVQLVGFLTLIVQAYAASKKASAERKDAAAAAAQQFEQARADVALKAKIDDARVERDRKWAVEDREAAAAAVIRAEQNVRQMSVRIDGAARMAKAALAATNIGTGLEDDAPPPVPNRRQRTGTIADRKPPVEEPLMDLGARVLFAPGFEDDLGAAATVTGSTPP